MFKCSEVTEMASDYVDRNLGWWTRTQLRMHVALCRHCRRYVEQIEATMALLRDLRLSDPQSADDIAARLLTRPTEPSGS